MALVRLLFILAVAAIAVSALLYLFTKDRRYLRCIGLTVKLTIVLFAIILAFFFVERLFMPGR